MDITAIAAISENDIIGVDNQLPWHLPADLAHFKKCTVNKPVLMGRKTFDSIGQPLPKRQNIVLTRSRDFYHENVACAHSWDEAIALADNAEELMIIGGGDIYRLAWPHLTRIKLTRVHTTLEGDVSFPFIDPNEWSLLDKEIHQADEANPYDYTFYTYERT